jgi:transmembrane sensor
MNKITEQQFYDLLSLKLSGDATAADLALLQQQLTLNPQWQFLYDQMMQPHTPVSNHEHTEQAFAAHLVKMQLQGKMEKTEDDNSEIAAETVYPARRAFYRRLTYGLLAAASVVAIFFFTGTYPPFSPEKKSNASHNEIVTKKGSRSNVKLPDGTQVWLNADSKISYAENFIGSSREVKLTGEAYFDVAHDSLHPFIIHTGKASIRVLGTAFNVRNYPQDDKLETTLMRGKIEVTITDRPEVKLIMKPLEKLVLSKTTGLTEPVNTRQNNNDILLTSVTYTGTDSAVAETSWLDDKLVFINQPLAKIAEELQRYYSVAISFEDPLVKEYRYTGTFNDVSIEKVMQIIQLSKKINYKINGKQILIK